MRVLLIKTSSMGDLIHTFPAITDASHAIPTLKFDWLVEDTFTEIPKWHRAVDHVIPVSLRRWRKGLFSAHTKTQLKNLYETLHKEQYDLILDAQGLIKSAFLSLFAKGKRAGLDFKSAREPFASLFYQQKYKVYFYQHAVTRMRLLFSQALNYPTPKDAPQFGLVLEPESVRQNKLRSDPYLVFLHGTTWTSKEWPQIYWLELAKIAARAGFTIKLSGGNDVEMKRAVALAKEVTRIEVLPYLSISDMASCLSHAKGVVAVDTGLGHLAAALNIPTVSIYGATDPAYTGALGDASIHLAAGFSCSPCLSRKCSYKKDAEVTPACYGTVTPEVVWQHLVSVISPSPLSLSR